MIEPKQVAVDFLTLVIAGKIDEAYSNYVDMDGKHHNVFFAAGFSVLCHAMKENDAQFARKRFTIKNVLCDGDLVVVHSHLVLKISDVGMVTFHMFRILNGKIIEMWDCGQVIPHDLKNNDGAF